MNLRQHWEKLYATKAPDQVSWFCPHLETSLALIERVAPDRRVNLIDVGGGASTLVDDLIARGYRNVTVLDISEAAVEIAKRRLAGAEAAVHWLCADVRQPVFPARAFDVWHDRAVFHFLTDPEDRAKYVRNVASAVKPHGHIIVSTFGPEGPLRCSGLEVVRYDSESLHREFGLRFRLVESSRELHQTPFGTTQQFLYCCCTLEGEIASRDVRREARNAAGSGEQVQMSSDDRPRSKIRAQDGSGSRRFAHASEYGGSGPCDRRRA